jgi:uncharacterized membrane protein YdbT with pleckstrin-like domain
MTDEDLLAGGDGGAAESDDGRVVYFEGRRTWLNFWKSLSFGVIGFTAGFVYWTVEGNLWSLFGGLLLAAVIYGYVCMVRSMALYLVTPRRVEIIYGLITKSSNEVRVKDIRTINVKKSGFKGLLGVGNVEFSSSGGDGSEVIFRDVWAAQSVKALVRELQDEDRK